MDDGYMVTTDLVIDLNWRMGEGGGSRIMPIAHWPEQRGAAAIGTLEEKHVWTCEHHLETTEY